MVETGKKHSGIISFSLDSYQCLPLARSEAAIPGSPRYKWAVVTGQSLTVCNVGLAGNGMDLREQGMQKKRIGFTNFTNNQI